MSELYFNKFPITQYANSDCVNITKRVVIDNSRRQSPIVYDDYELKNATRSDVIAENYYEDPNMEWMIWLTNGIIDPYYGWNLSSSDFDAHLTKKYGSIESASKRIMYYQNNWKNDDTELSVSFYENTLSDNLKKYYSPVYNDGITIIGYVRKADDTIVNTNKIYHFNITLNGNTRFSVGEIVDIKSTSPSAIVGGGEVVFANTTVLKIKNISGNTSSNNIVVGETSNAAANVTASTLLVDNITNEETVYWSAVTAYDFEYSLNEEKKHILLMNPTYASELAYDLRTKFKK